MRSAIALLSDPEHGPPVKGRTILSQVRRDSVLAGSTGSPDAMLTHIMVSEGDEMASGRVPLVSRSLVKTLPIQRDEDGKAQLQESLIQHMRELLKSGDAELDSVSDELYAGSAIYLDSPSCPVEATTGIEASEGRSEDSMAILVALVDSTMVHISADGEGSPGAIWSSSELDVGDGVRISPVTFRHDSEVVQSMGMLARMVAER